jgi:hypothetical protein
MSSDEHLIEALAQDITEYLERNAQAADDISGISRWWLRDGRPGKTLERVRASLELLESRGVIRRTVLKDGHVIYDRLPVRP